MSWRQCQWIVFTSFLPPAPRRSSVENPSVSKVHAGSVPVCVIHRNLTPGLLTCVGLLIILMRAYTTRVSFPKLDLSEGDSFWTRSTDIARQFLNTIDWHCIELNCHRYYSCIVFYICLSVCCVSEGQKFAHCFFLSKLKSVPLVSFDLFAWTLTIISVFDFFPQSF